MVDITPLIQSGQKVIQSYKKGAFRISGQTYEGPVIVFPDRVISWQLSDITKPSPDDFSALWQKPQDELALATPDVVLFGCGRKQVFYPPSFKAALKEKKLSVEIMDTGAACRTYNVLLADGRAVATALLPF